MELKEFQLNAVKSLFEAMDKPVRDIILKSPTGSGKTIILTYFMHQYIQSYPKTVFVWLTPGKGNLEEQSKAKMDKYIHASQTKLLSDVMTAGFEENDSCFINWEKLTKKGNNALKDSERTNFLEHIEHALNDGLRFIIIVDESHQNNTIKADEIIQYFRTEKIPQLLDMMFDNEKIISPDSDMKEVNDLFSKLYQQYLGRKLCQAEKSVLSTAVRIMIWKIYGKTFHRICQYRYAYASRTTERQQLYRKGDVEAANSIPAKYIVGYHDIPDKDLTPYPLISTSISAKDVDYDLIVYDTYDYLDKLIGFKLSDIFYAVFYQYYEATSDECALRLAKYFKYGTDKEREIWMLRYGFSFEETELVSECIDFIDETEIKFNDRINALNEAQLQVIEQYVHE